jgi:hypothetical protein
LINSVCDTLDNDHSVQGNAHTRKGRVDCVWRFGCNYHPNGLKKTYTNPEGITYTYYDVQGSTSAVGAGSARGLW